MLEEYLIRLVQLFKKILLDRTSVICTHQFALEVQRCKAFAASQAIHPVFRMGCTR